MNSSYIQISTFILWSSCLVIGGLGIAVPYARPRPLAPEPAPVQAEILNVELSNHISTQPPAASHLAILSTPPPAVTIQTPPATPMLAVVEANLSIAFALPVEGSVLMVEKAQASFAQAVEPQEPAKAVPHVQALTFGQGEGKQPAPEYPYKAMKEGQQGTVKVRFTVDESGRVLSAEAANPSPWQLLNAAAVKVVKERWRFRSGAARTFEVAIRFELQ